MACNYIEKRTFVILHLLPWSKRWKIETPLTGDEKTPKSHNGQVPVVDNKVESSMDSVADMFCKFKI